MEGFQLKKKMDLILHPVRLKIVQSLLNGKTMTVQQLAERVEDVPQATLYRHLKKLLEASILSVVQENQIRGTVEKVYALNEPAIQSHEDLLNLTKEEHLEMFMHFTTHLMGMYESYLEKEKPDLVKDGVTYRVANVHLSDEEYMEMAQEIGKIIVKAMKNEPSPERKSRNIATIVIPE